MWKAIRKTMELVDLNGILVIAIYNRHWSSSVWKFVRSYGFTLRKFKKPKVPTGCNEYVFERKQRPWKKTEQPLIYRFLNTLNNNS
jgi:precorrin-3B methylase